MLLCDIWEGGSLSFLTEREGVGERKGASLIAFSVVSKGFPGGFVYFFFFFLGV